MRRGLVLTLAALLALFGTTSSAPAMGCYGYDRQTLREGVAGASLVCYVTFSNPYLQEDEQAARTGRVGQLRKTDLVRIQPIRAKGAGEETILYVGSILKSVPVLRDTKFIRLPRKIPPEAGGYVVFCDWFKGQLDPYRGLPIKSVDLVPYLRGALALPPGLSEQGFHYFLDHLSNKDAEIAADAIKELARYEPKDLSRFAPKLSPDRIARYLQDPGMWAYAYELCALLLGHCGTAKHAVLVRKLLDDPTRREGGGFDGLLVAYTMLRPREGWAYLCGVARDRSLDFRPRFAALWAMRFLWETQPNAVGRKEILDAVASFLDQGDMADLAIEDLRKWGCWGMTERVLALHGKAGFDVPIVRRAILRFAMSSPFFNAAEFVRDMRRQDPEAVAEIEELLALERRKDP
jgi:hypothetical protein